MAEKLNVSIRMRQAWWVKPYMAWCVLKARLGLHVDLDAAMTKIEKGLIVDVS